MRKRWWWVAIAVTLVLALAVGSVVVLRGREAERRRKATDVAVSFLTAWQERRYDDLNAITAGTDAGPAVRSSDDRLQVTAVRTVPGTLSADATELPFDVTLSLAGLGDFSYRSRVALGDSSAGPLVRFGPSTIHPDLTDGRQLQRTRLPVRRAAILDRAGRVIQPASADLAGNVLGTVGAAPQPKGLLLTGDPTGVSGLERVLDDQLVGTPGGAVVLADEAGAVLRELQAFPASPGKDVRTTLDLDLQAAADAALAGAPSRAALVAIDAATGEVRALANRPVDGLPATFAGYAPGSVFKIVTATAALRNGVTADTPVDCPDTFTVGGRTFRNDEGLAPLGQIPFSRAFAVSCNTAFLGVAGRLPSGALQDAAALYGFGRTDLLPIRAEGGTVPPPASPVEAAADAIGQGRVQASPLLVASMSAAVADGTWRQPRLLAGDGATTPLPAGVAEALRPLMRGVVTSGTGRAADLPGTPVQGKTGTAEYGTANPPLTHAWFTGFRGSLAFAVFVETGSSGGGAAAPIARRFLAAVPG